LAIFCGDIPETMASDLGAFSEQLTSINTEDHPVGTPNPGENSRH
jgi:hypothetical protein